MSVHVDHGTSVTQLREECYEIAIAGGGLVGMSLAVALGRAGISVALIEARGAQRQGDPGYDSRPIALSQSSRRILDTLGDGPFIFNLGHGILPQTPIAHVEDLLELIRK